MFLIHAPKYFIKMCLIWVPTQICVTIWHITSYFFFKKTFQEIYFRYRSLHFLFLFQPVCLIPPKPSLFSPSVLPHFEFSLKQKWMRGHLGWGIWGHALVASHITLLCVIGCRIWPGQCYLIGPSSHIRSVCMYLLSWPYKICSC